MTTVLAIYAAIVSTGSLLLSLRAFRANRPRLKFELDGARDGDVITLFARFENAGGSGITVNGILASLVPYISDAQERPLVGEPRYEIFPEDWDGFPFRLDAHAVMEKRANLTLEGHPLADEAAIEAYGSADCVGVPFAFSSTLVRAHQS